MTFEEWMNNKGFEIDATATKRAIYLSEMQGLAIGCDPADVTISFSDSRTKSTDYKS